MTNEEVKKQGTEVLDSAWNWAKGLGIDETTTNEQVAEVIAARFGLDKKAVIGIIVSLDIAGKLMGSSGIVGLIVGAYLESQLGVTTRTAVN